MILTTIFLAQTHGQVNNIKPYKFIVAGGHMAVNVLRFRYTFHYFEYFNIIIIDRAL